MQQFPGQPSTQFASKRTPLGPTRGRRVVHALGGAIVGFAAFWFGVAAGACVHAYFTEPDMTLLMLILGLFLALMALVLGWITFGIYRNYVWRRAALVIDTSSLTIDDPRGLREPFVTPIANVTAFSLDSMSSIDFPMFGFRRARTWHGLQEREATVEIHGSFNQPGDMRAPFLPTGAAGPNLLLVFAQPVRFDVSTILDGDRRRLKTIVWASAVSLPTRRPDEAAAMLSERGVRGHVDASDWAAANHVVPIEGEHHSRASDTAVKHGWQPGMPRTYSVNQQAPGPIVAEMQPLQVTEPAVQQPIVSSSKGLPPERITAALRRAALGFYAMVIGGLAALVAATICLLVTLPSIAPAVFLGAWTALIGWSALPRIYPEQDEVNARIDPRTNLRFARNVGELARRLGADPPAEVRISLDDSAMIAFREADESVLDGGELTLGLSLLAGFDEREFDATVAHELAHQLVTPTVPGAFWRAVASTRSMAWISGLEVLGAPYRGAIGWFENRSLLLFREIEYRADEHAARVCGADAMAACLKRAVVARSALPLYWTRYVAPSLELGYQPPIAAGFSNYLRESVFASTLRGDVDALVAHDHNSLNGFASTHPTDAQRIAHLQQVAPGQVRQGLPTVVRPAIDLFDTLAAAESEIVSALAEDIAPGGGMRRASWEQVLPMVFRSDFERDAQIASGVLGGYAIDQLPALVQSGEWIAQQFQMGEWSQLIHLRENPHAETFPREAVVTFLLMNLLGGVMLRRGYTVSCDAPGAPIVFSNGTRSTDIHSLYEEAESAHASDSWIMRINQLGVAGEPLAPLDGAANSNGIMASAAMPPSSPSVA